MEDYPYRERPVVLAADDDYSTRLLIRASLEEAGFAVEEAEDGRSALAAFSRCRPDIVLLDVLMPGMDGFAVCEAIRREPGAQDLPIVMVTGLDDTDSITRAYDMGATDFITKPINWTILGYRVRYVLRAQQAILQRHKLEELLFQSQKMEAIGRLAGGVAHDFNNILMAIIGCSDLLLNQMDMQESGHHLVTEIRDAAEQAASLTNQLLAFSSKQVLQPQTFDLRLELAEMEKMLRRMIGEDIQLITTPGSEPALIEADPGQIKQVVMNLVINARDAMPRGGRITMTISNVHLEEAHDHRHLEREPGPYVVLAISDTGEGMDPVTQARIFEPFFTTRKRHKGTGLGLSSVHGIVKQSGGFICVSSEPGLGSTFKIFLPKVEQPENEMVLKGQSAKSPQGSETILIVEDNAVVRRVVKKILINLGYQVLEAADSDEALGICAEYSGPIHLLFTDVIMPGMNGRDLAERWVARRPNTKIIFTSGYTEDTIAHQGALEEGIHFMQKPYRPDLLARKIREVLD